jgi:hypothetical protein
VHNVSLGGGAITIAAITSVAHAVSDTVKATGSAATTVSGMKIAGVPVTVDDKGLHVAGQGSTLPGSDQLNQALAQSGFQVFVAKPSKVVHGAAITLDSGNLVLMQNNSQYVHQANDTARLLILGGANIQANTGKGFSFGSIALPPPPPPPATTTGTATAGTPGTPGLAGTAGTTTGSAPQVAGQPPVLAANNSPLGHKGLSVGWTVALLLGAGALAFGLRRLPDEVLAARGTSCPLGETTS